ncbi:PREDICTED: uncharacterized protein LOC109240335 [Nicotiana attenuata]|uniref:uncharacterized protein LOC109240335 n=1 Tax=Nicotiana attenuata TaxID=49451 RepID=UPI0009048681|nr:PREDICTED: uncharacterized protein LOC109240335 [Nicotiana attenuata]
MEEKGSLQDWVMECISSIPYSIGINGWPTEPFAAKRGLRGDLISVQMLYDCFQEFPQVSGLIADKEKSSIYFGGVRDETQRAIMEMIGFSKVEIPFRYLGVPLRRVQLIKNVLFSIQIYWSQIFVLPTKVIKLIEATCRRFSWTGGVELTKRTLLAWQKVCYPASAGGLNILDIAI